MLMNWLFYENMIVNIFMNGIPDLSILIIHIEITIMYMSYYFSVRCCAAEHFGPISHVLWK